jgi:predicted acetyltransferase
MGRFVEGVMEDDRARDGDFLVVERDGMAVGTATALHLTMHVRGAAIPCHGVAYVGAIRTERRKAAVGGVKEPGVATVVMEETIRRGRERGDVVTALMPFRASYYEHFGYGLVERQLYWNIPTSVLPSGDAGRWVHYEEGHLPGLMALRREMMGAGQCDIERTEGRWKSVMKKGEGGWTFVELDGDGRPAAWLQLGAMSEVPGGRPHVGRVGDWGCRGPGEGMARVLRFLGSLKDQYTRVLIDGPSDWQINRLLKETQVPHREVVHPTATATMITRMQMRVLDHKRYLEAIGWPGGTKGEAVVLVKECEGGESRFAVRVEGGRAEVRPSVATPTFVTTDVTYASVVSGELSATEAVRMGLAEGEAGILDGLAVGRKPYCGDFF